MPGEDGVAACGRIRAIYRLSDSVSYGQGEDEDVLNGLGAGGDDYLTKPLQRFTASGKGGGASAPGTPGALLPVCFRRAAL